MPEIPVMLQQESIFKGGEGNTTILKTRRKQIYFFWLAGIQCYLPATGLLFLFLVFTVILSLIIPCAFVTNAIQTVQHFSLDNSTKRTA